ncbi:necdin [Myotis yumanensis]|uniref:necdin n=1 Tax=Myotis yumanensis TaxID=159337 RepID=UPI0038D4D32C
MSEASKQGCDPTFAAEAAAQAEACGGPGVPGGPPSPALASASASQAAEGSDSPPVGSGDAAAASPPPPEVWSDEEDPKALLQAAEQEQEQQPEEEEAEAEEEEEGCARRAPSAAQAGPVPPPTAAQLVQKAHELMWYVLMKDQRRMVIWFPDMVRDVLGNYKKWCRSILRRTSLILARVFGLHLRLTSLHTMEFSLVKALEPAELERVALGGRMPMMGLLLMILSLIYVKGRGARESAVWNVLRILGLRPWKKHSTFGDVRRLLTEELVQQNYLKYQRVPQAEPPEFEFYWGSRSTREITKLQIMEYLARVFKKDPQAWPTRYREALEEARARRAAAPPTPCPRNSFSED